MHLSITRVAHAYLSNRAAAQGKRAGLSDVATTILDQMGGWRKLRMMLGVKQFFNITNGVGFKWPSKQRSKGNYVEVKVNGLDLYDMTFFNVSIRGKKKVKEYRGLYDDMLANTFEKQTGYYIRLGSIDRVARAHLSKQAAFDKDIVKATERVFKKLTSGNKTYDYGKINVNIKPDKKPGQFMLTVETDRISTKGGGRAPGSKDFGLVLQDMTGMERPPDAKWNIMSMLGSEMGGVDAVGWSRRPANPKMKGGKVTFTFPVRIPVGSR